MLRGVVETTAAQTEEEDGDQLPGQMSNRSMTGNAASSQSPVIVREGRGRLPRRNQLHGPEPDLPAPEAIAAFAQAGGRYGGSALARLRVPAEVPAQLPVIPEAVHVPGRAEQ